MNRTFFKNLKYLGLIIAPAIIPTSTSAQIVGSYNIVAAHSGKCAQVNGATQNNGAVISQWDCSTANNVQWTFVYAGQGYFYIKAKHSGKCAQVNGATQDNGAVISQWDCADANNVKWKLNPIVIVK